MARCLLWMMVVVLLSGCATPISTSQKREMRAYEAKDLVVEEKSVAGAAILGILPGGGSFYTRNYGLGVLNLLLWPASVLWDPISGVNGAEEINYYATREEVRVAKNRERLLINRELEDGKIGKEEHKLKMREMEDKYSAIM